MSKTDMAELKQRLLDGTYSASDVETAERIVKGLRDGSVSAEDLSGVHAFSGDPAPVEPAATPEPEAPVAQAPAPVTVPEPDALRKSLLEQPETQRAVNAVPVIQAMVGSIETLTEAVQAMNAARAEDTALIKSLSAQVEALAKAPATIPDTRGDRDASTDNRLDLKKSVGADMAEALGGVLKETGIISRLEAIERRPFAGNPPRGRGGEPLKKSLTEGDLTKGVAISTIQKALGAKQITEDEATNALAKLDVAHRVGETFETVLQQVGLLGQ